MFERVKAFLWGTLLIIVGVAYLIYSGVAVVTAADIAQNGKVTVAKVISSRMETRRSGRRSVRIVYVHTVQFDGKRANMDLIAPRPDGSTMKVIYLKSNPGDVRVFVSRDWGDVLGWSEIQWGLNIGVPIIFFVAGGSWLVVAFRRRRRGRRATVGVTPPAPAAPDPYPPTPSGQYGAQPGYAPAPGAYPPAPTPSGQYGAQPGYPSAPAPGQWPPPDQGGYPPQR